MRIVLVEPEIPQNTGSIARLAAATRTPLDLVGTLGFSLEDRYLKRAGLDYWPLVELGVYPGWQEYLENPPNGASVRRLAFSVHAGPSYTECMFKAEDSLVFGKESSGLGDDFLSAFAGQVYRIPIDEPGVRSLNLSNAVAIVLYEARRQLGLASVG
ncbi:MAG: tRNA (cytidine(34)-2'-O)-methyltransferase [Deltaproteobacteria bacterium]